MKLEIPVDDIALITLADDQGVVQLHCEVYRWSKTSYKRLLIALEHAFDVANSDKVYTGCFHADDKMMKCWLRVGFKLIGEVNGLSLAVWER